MLEELLNKGYFNYKKFISENSIELNLSPNDILVIITLLDGYVSGNRKINLEDIQNKYLLSKNDLTSSLSKLLENNFYSVSLVETSNGLEEEISFKPFIKK